MTLPLSPEMLAAAYDFVRACPPYSRWKLPESDDIKFVVDRQHDTCGWYRFENNEHVIGISSKCIGHTHNLIEIMFHEAIHLYQRQSLTETRGAHNAAFKKLAAKVAKLHGFDPKMF
jgi:hypothetical protein